MGRARSFSPSSVTSIAKPIFSIKVHVRSTSSAPVLTIIISFSAAFSGINNGQRWRQFLFAWPANERPRRSEARPGPRGPSRSNLVRSVRRLAADAAASCPRLVRAAAVQARARRTTGTHRHVVLVVMVAMFGLRRAQGKQARERDGGRERNLSGFHGCFLQLRGRPTSDGTDGFNPGRADTQPSHRKRPPQTGCTGHERRRAPAVAELSGIPRLYGADGPSGAGRVLPIHQKVAVEAEAVA